MVSAVETIVERFIEISRLILSDNDKIATAVPNKLKIVREYFVFFTMDLSNSNNNADIAIN